MTWCLEMEHVPNVDAGDFVMWVNRNHPGRWGDDEAPGIGETMGPQSGE